MTGKLTRRVPNSVGFSFTVMHLEGRYTKALTPIKLFGTRNVAIMDLRVGIPPDLAVGFCHEFNLYAVMVPTCL